MVNALVEFLIYMKEWEEDSVRVLTSFNADDGSSESQRDSEALPHVDDSVKQAILAVGVRDHTLLLLQWLHTDTHTFKTG